MNNHTYFINCKWLYVGRRKIEYKFDGITVSNFPSDKRKKDWRKRGTLKNVDLVHEKSCLEKMKNWFQIISPTATTL